MILHIVAEEYNVAFYYLSYFMNNRRWQQVSLSAQHNLWFLTYPYLSLSLSLCVCVFVWVMCVGLCTSIKAAHKYRTVIKLTKNYQCINRF